MFYVYCYFNPLKLSSLHDCGFEPFYVGKGKNDRKIHHLFESNLLRDPNRLKKNTILKIRSSGMEPHIQILGEFIVEQDAFTEESRLIKLWGRRDLALGPLTNMTDGGEGTANKVFTKEYRKKLSEAAKLIKPSSKTKQKISEALKGKKQTTEWIQKRSDARRGSTLSDQTKQKISEAHQLVRQTPEWKANASAAQLGKKHSREHTLKSISSNPRSCPVELMGAFYPSIGQAIKASGLTPGQLRRHPTFKLLGK